MDFGAIDVEAELSSVGPTNGVSPLLSLGEAEQWMLGG